MSRLHAKCIRPLCQCSLGHAPRSLAGTPPLLDCSLKNIKAFFGRVAKVEHVEYSPPNTSGILRMASAGDAFKLCSYLERHPTSQASCGDTVGDEGISGPCGFVKVSMLSGIRIYFSFGVNGCRG